VHIAANTLPDRVEVEITDDGRGIPADERARVFDRFVRLGASRERAGGSGGDHTGRITITDAPSGGARVVISLPKAPPEAWESSRNGGSAANQSGAQGAA
jgi:signal transduction histidine kinase